MISPDDVLVEVERGAAIRATALIAAKRLAAIPGLLLGLSFDDVYLHLVLAGEHVASLYGLYEMTLTHADAMAEDAMVTLGPLGRQWRAMAEARGSDPVVYSAEACRIGAERLLAIAARRVVTAEDLVAIVRELEAVVVVPVSARACA